MNNFTGYMISRELFVWMLTNIPIDSTILELGSGEGTELLTKFFKMYSVEDNKLWLNKYHNNYIYAPLDEKTGWYNRDYLIKYLPKEYSCLLIDAPAAINPNARLGLLDNLDLFNLNCTIIIDDTNRKAEKLLAAELIKRTGKKGMEITCKEKSFIIIQSETHEKRNDKRRFQKGI